MGNRDMKQWLWFIKIQAAWNLVVLSFTIWLLPESQSVWVAIGISVAVGPALWIMGGVAGYWLAVTFDRLTGLGFLLPGNPLTHRHPKSQAVMGAVLLAEVFLTLPLTWWYRKEMAQCVRPHGAGAPGIVISGKPSGRNDGRYLLKYVAGTTDYEEARARKQEAHWLALSALDEFIDQGSASLSH
jgi:hypothetical protein